MDIKVKPGKYGGDRYEVQCPFSGVTFADNDLHELRARLVNYFAGFAVEYKEMQSRLQELAIDEATR